MNVFLKQSNYSTPFFSILNHELLYFFLSLPNISNQVRWSLDLRWQRPNDPDGLWGLKKPILMRTKDNPNYEIDWTEFDAVDRHSQQKKAVGDVSYVQTCTKQSCNDSEKDYL